jgi:hypothetical protein
LSQILFDIGKFSETPNCSLATFFRDGGRSDSGYLKLSRDLPERGNMRRRRFISDQKNARGDFGALGSHFEVARSLLPGL